MQTESFAETCADGFLIRLYVQPGASRSAVTGLRVEDIGGRKIERLKIAVRARAVEGAANEALIEFLAKLLGCPKSQISLTAGESNRSKTVLVKTSQTGIVEKLKALADKN